MQKLQRPCLPLNALLLVAVLLLQGCKPDSTPDAFSFATQTKVAPNTLIESETATISGMNLPAQLIISGGEYSIDGSAYRSTPGLIKNDQKIRIRIRSSSESSGEPSLTSTIS